MVLSWLTRLILGLALLGVVGYDGIAIGASHAGASDDATGAATDAALAWQRSHDVTRAQRAAQAALTRTESLVPGSLSIAPNGHVTLTIHRTVDTIVASHLPGIGRSTSFTARGSADAPAT